MTMTSYAEQYADDSFRRKAKRVARRAGREIAERALVLYYTLRDTDTPAWARAVIVSALGYFVMPLDAVPDPTPVLGFVDDLWALAAALPVVALYVKTEHRERARAKIARWLP
jgi:uncharacterized membrane protein YkvA (DUF1232 family)